jgi:hypothetical protein
MNCLHCKNELLESVRHAAELKPEVFNHLILCAACKDFFESQKELDAELKSLKSVDFTAKPDASAREKLLVAMRNPKPAHSGSYFWLKAAAVFVISILCGSLWIYQKEYRQNQSGKIQESAKVESSNDYIPLTYGMTPGESLQRVRVKLPRSALNDFGIAVKQARTEEVTADVIIGESGVPYAIRVVQQSN